MQYFPDFVMVRLTRHSPTLLPQKFPQSFTKALKQDFTRAQKSFKSIKKKTFRVLAELCIICLNLCHEALWDENKFAERQRKSELNWTKI